MKTFLGFVLTILIPYYILGGMWHLRPILFSQEPTYWTAPLFVIFCGVFIAVFLGGMIAAAYFLSPSDIKKSVTERVNNEKKKPTNDTSTTGVSL